MWWEEWDRRYFRDTGMGVLVAWSCSPNHAKLPSILSLPSIHTFSHTSFDQIRPKNKQCLQLFCKYLHQFTFKLNGCFFFNKSWQSHKTHDTSRDTHLAFIRLIFIYHSTRFLPPSPSCTYTHTHTHNPDSANGKRPRSSEGFLWGKVSTLKAIMFHYSGNGRTRFPGA